MKWLLNLLSFKTSLGESLDRYYIIKLFGFALFVHRLHKDEPDRLFHNHPWSGISFHFGTYAEWTADLQFNDDHEIVGVTTTGHRRRWFNYVPFWRYHRITLPYGPVWSVFIHFPKVKGHKWSALDTVTGKVVHEPWEGTGKDRSYGKALQVEGEVAVPVSAIRLDPQFNTRKGTEGVAELARSLEANGFNPDLDASKLVIVQEITDKAVPLTISKGYRLLDGLARFEALKQLEAKTVACRFIGTNEVVDVEINKIK